MDDVPPFYEGSMMLKTKFDYPLTEIKFSTTLKINVFIAVPEKSSNPLPDSFKVLFIIRLSMTNYQS